MATRLFVPLTRIFFDQSATWRLLFFSVFGYGFSLAVILSTLGLMDGFEATLKQGLRLSAGDAIITSSEGFFDVSDPLLEELQRSRVKAYSGVLQAEAFALSEGRSQGVLVRGVEASEFENVTGMRLKLSEQGAVVGEVLARDWSLVVGDEITLVLAKGREGEMPQFLTLKVSDITKHGIYEKDQRFVYVERSLLASTLAQSGKNNLMLLSFKVHDLSALEQLISDLDQNLGSPWRVRATWQEFAGLLEAVAVEKTSIAIVLQLIVLVAVFNVAAFLITLRARKVREFFLLRAFGMPQSRFMLFSMSLLILVWAISCGLSIVLVKIFNWLLADAPWLQVPGDVYVLTRLQVMLDVGDYSLVFGLALAWMLILGLLAARKMQKLPLLTGLRQEFQ